MAFCSGEKRPFQRRHKRSSAELTHVVAKAILDITWLVKAVLHQGRDPAPAGRAAKGGSEGVPLRCDIRIRWKAEQTLLGWATNGTRLGVLGG